MKLMKVMMDLVLMNRRVLWPEEENKDNKKEPFSEMK